MAAVCHRSGWNGARGFWGDGGNRGHMRGRYVLIWAHSDVAGQRGHVANRFGLRWPHREKWGDWGARHG